MTEKIVITKYHKISGNKTFSIGAVRYGWTPFQYFNYLTN